MRGSSACRRTMARRGSGTAFSRPPSSGLRIAHRAIEYRHAHAASKIRAAGLPDGYADALEQGLWPNCDILPAADLAARRIPLEPGEVLCRPQWKARTADPACDPHVENHWPDPRDPPKALGVAKFDDPDWTAGGEPRASVPLIRLETLWINTGTLCNITCRNCYIEFEPHQRPAGLSSLGRAASLSTRAEALAPSEIGFTGGEPFMNPDFLGMIEECARARLRGAGAHQCHAADAAAADRGRAARASRAFRRAADAPGQRRPFQQDSARGRAWARAAGTS